MNRLNIQKRAQIIGMMVEGVSIRAITRMTGASKNTVVKLLADVGTEKWLRKTEQRVKWRLRA